MRRIVSFTDCRRRASRYSQEAFRAGGCDERERKTLRRKEITPICISAAESAGGLTPNVTRTLQGREHGKKRKPPKKRANALENCWKSWKRLVNSNVPLSSGKEE